MQSLVTWRLPLVFIAAAAAVSASTETGLRDPVFSRLKFDQWLSDGQRPSPDWSAEILPAEISTHQRLMLRVVIRVEGRFLEKQRGSGSLLTLVEYRDSHAHIWQHHTSLDLTKLPPGAGTRQTAIAQYAFVLPGDYSLAIAVCNTATLEHTLIVREVHADPLPADPLPGAWNGLPAVEFLPAITEPPDVWYLPGIDHRLNLSLTTRRPVHVEVLVNTTPSDSVAGSLSGMRANMSAVIPALKVISQINIPNGSLDIAFLDLTRLRVAFEQKNVAMPAWDGIREIFLNTKPGVIDVEDLANHSRVRQYFRDEVSRRLNIEAQGTGDAPVPIVIVLSGPAFLENAKTQLVTESATGAPRDGDGRLFYIRFVTYPPPPLIRPRRGQTAAPAIHYTTPFDDLELALEPLHARIYEAPSVEQFRQVLADLLERVSTIQ